MSEVEHLKAQLDDALRELTETRRFWQAARAEVERLKADIAFTDGELQVVNRALQDELRHAHQVNENLRAEATRNVLTYTAKGFAAGEHADSKAWRERAEQAEAEVERLTQENKKTGTRGTPMDIERIEQIQARLNAASKGPWAAYRMTHEERGDDLTPDELGEYVKNSVVKSEGESGSSAFLFVSVEKTDGRSADVCHVGNGPMSPQNADFIAHAPNDIAFLLAELQQLRQQLDDFLKGRITKAMLLERAERAERELAQLRQQGEQMTPTELKAHVRAIQRAVESQLPEDEPDCTREWVYETAVKVIADRLRQQGAEPK